MRNSIEPFKQNAHRASDALKRDAMTQRFSNKTPKDMLEESRRVSTAQTTSG